MQDTVDCRLVENDLDLNSARKMFQRRNCGEMKFRKKKNILYYIAASPSSGPIYILICKTNAYIVECVLNRNGRKDFWHTLYVRYDIR